MRAIVQILLPSKILKYIQPYCFIILAILFLVSCNKEKATGTPGDKLIERAENKDLDGQTRTVYLDSAFSQFRLQKNDSILRYSLRRLAVSYFDIGNYDKSIEVSNEVLRLATLAGDSLSMGKANYFAGLSYYQEGTVDKALRHFRDAEKVLRPLNNRDLGSLLLYKAYVFHDVGEYVLCESEAFMALAVLEKHNDNYQVFQCLVVIALALNEQDNTVEAIKYYQEALKQIEKLKGDGYAPEFIESLSISCYSNIGLVYAKEREYDKAIEQYNIALKSDVVRENHYWKSKILNNLALAKFKKGDDNGVKGMFFEALKLSDSLDNKQELVASNLNIGVYYASKKDTASAINYLGKAYKKAKEINSNSDKLNALKELISIDSKNSTAYSKQYIKLNDSLEKATLQNRNKFARIEYETNQLRDEKDALAKKNSFIIGISVLVLLFVAAIFIIYYLNSRNKELLHVQEQQKASEEIYQLMFEQQSRIESARSEEKNRIAMELHDGILNNIYAVRLNLEFSNRKTDEESVVKRKGFIKELQVVESEIRSVSHDLSRSAQFVQGKDFTAMLEFMVNTQKNNFDTEFEISIDPNLDWDEIPNTYKVNIYRIVQEALQNVNKYSKASHAYVNVYVEGRQLVVTVRDNGVGFDIKKAAGGIGLKNLRKRSEALNGLLEIDSEEGKGALVKVQFALR